MFAIKWNDDMDAEIATVKACGLKPLRAMSKEYGTPQTGDVSKLAIARLNRFLPPVPVPPAVAAEPKDEPKAVELDCGATDVLAASTEGKTLDDIGGVDVMARFIEPTAKAKAKSEDNAGVKQDEADVWMGAFAFNAIADYVFKAERQRFLLSSSAYRRPSGTAGGG